MRSYRVLVTAIALGVACRFASSEDTNGVPIVPILVTPDSLAFHGRAGDTLLPDRYLTIAFGANVHGTWTAHEDGSWFLLPVTSESEPSLLTVAARPAGLGAGTYAASIWITTGNYTVRVPVTLELALAASVSGRWVGRADTLHVALDLTQTGGQVTGSGTVAMPVGRVGVTGTWTGPGISLVLAAPSDTLRFVGSLLDGNALAGTLTRTGASPPSVPLTLYRQ